MKKYFRVVIEKHGKTIFQLTLSVESLSVKNTPIAPTIIFRLASLVESLTSLVESLTSLVESLASLVELLAPLAELLILSAILII